MTDEPKFKYGLSKELFVTRKPGGDSILVGGVGEGDARWTRVLSFRAAQVLWFHLAQYLNPDKAKQVTAAVMTAPIRDSGLPTITTHMSVEETAGERKNYEIIGWSSNRPVWRAQLTLEEAERFWTALDGVLYPSGSAAVKKNDPPA